MSEKEAYTGEEDSRKLYGKGHICNYCEKTGDCNKIIRLHNLAMEDGIQQLNIVIFECNAMIRKSAEE